MNAVLPMWAVSLGVASGCGAQQAIVAVTHNDADGIVAPGEVVQLSVTLSWTGVAWYLQELRGDLLASGDVGSASQPRFPYPNYAFNPGVSIVSPGSPSGGSVLGTHIFTGAQIWILFMSPAAPWYHAWGIEVLRVDWTAPSIPGSVAFDFAGDPQLPEPTFLGPAPSAFSLPTTYVGTSLTVIPAPSAAAVAGVGLALAAVRRRRPAR